MPVKDLPSPAFSLFIHLFPDVSDHVPFQGTGLHLDSTATRHTWRGVPLWLHGPTYPGTDPLGVLTKRPCSSSLAGGAAFAARRFSRQSSRHGEYNGSSGNRSATPCQGGSARRYTRTRGMPGSCSLRPLSPPCYMPAEPYRRGSHAVRRTPTVMRAGWL